MPKTVQCILEGCALNVNKMASFSASEWCIRTVQRIVSDLAQYDDRTRVNSSGCTVDSARTCLSRNAAAEIFS